MPNAISNKEQVAYIAESSWGTTPATPTGRIVRYNSLTDTASYNTTKSAEITNSREVADLIYTSAAGGLQINSELSLIASRHGHTQGSCYTTVITTK